jgi:hypothetical protein
METFTNLTKTELEALEAVRTRSDWPGIRHDCLMTQQSYAFLMPATRRERINGIPWELQFVAIIDVSGFELGE